MNAGVRLTRGAGEIVFSLEGEVDLSNAGAVEEEIRQSLDDDSRIVIDLSDTAYLDSAGLRLLFSLARSLGERLSLVVPEGSSLRRVVTMVGLPKVVPLLPGRPSQPPA